MQQKVEPTVDTYNVSLDQQIIALEAHITDDTPIEKLSKEDLVALHLNNIAILQSSSKNVEPKPLMLAPAYAPSIASLNDLQKVESIKTSYQLKILLTISRFHLQICGQKFTIEVAL